MGSPNGVDLCSETFAGSTLSLLSNGYTDKEITFDPTVELSSGSEYAIVVRSPDSDGITMSIAWAGVAIGNYSNGQAKISSDSGSSWNDDSTIDRLFQTFEGAAYRDQYYPGSGLTAYAFWGEDWYAQTFVATSTYTINKVTLKLAKVSAGEADVIVSIQATGESTPTKATNPTPTNAADDVSLNLATLTWEDGGGADTYNVYYGTESGNLSLVASDVETGSESFTVLDISDGSPYEYLITRYWRIDSINEYGTTTGDEWSFTTIQLDAPSQTYWYSTGGYYYRLLPQEGGTYGDPPPTGVEDTDYEVLTGYLPNFINTNKRLVAATRNSLYYEDI